MKPGDKVIITMTGYKGTRYLGFGIRTGMVGEINTLTDWGGYRLFVNSQWWWCQPEDVKPLPKDAKLNYAQNYVINE